MARKCEICHKILVRKRLPHGGLEKMAAFRIRKTCDREENPDCYELLLTKRRQAFIIRRAVWFNAPVDASEKFCRMGLRHL